MRAVRLSRRGCLTLLASGSVLGLLSACGGAATVTTGTATASVASAAASRAAPATSASASSAATSAAATSTAAASSTASTAAVVAAATPTPAPVVIKQGFTEVRVWVHWGGQSKDLLQKQVIDSYNNGQGTQDKIQVVVESKDNSKWQEEMTLARVGGDPRRFIIPRSAPR